MLQWVTMDLWEYGIQFLANKLLWFLWRQTWMANRSQDRKMARLAYQHRQELSMSTIQRSTLQWEWEMDLWECSRFLTKHLSGRRFLSTSANIGRFQQNGLKIWNLALTASISLSPLTITSVTYSRCQTSTILSVSLARAHLLLHTLTGVSTRVQSGQTTALMNCSTIVSLMVSNLHQVRHSSKTKFGKLRVVCLGGPHRVSGKQVMMDQTLTTLTDQTNLWVMGSKWWRLLTIEALSMCLSTPLQLTRLLSTLPLKDTAPTWQRFVSAQTTATYSQRVVMTQPWCSGR